jgi:hypothetical protein
MPNATIPACINTVVSEDTTETVRNDHKHGTTPVWVTTVVTMVDFVRGEYIGRTYRDVMVFESTHPVSYRSGVVIGHHQDPVDVSVDGPWENTEARMDRIEASGAFA